MKKFFYIIFLFIFPIICYAWENKVDIIVEKKDNVILKIDSKEEKIYGLSGNFNYDENSLEFSRCEAGNNYDVTVQNGIIVVDNVKALNNSNIVTCYFDIKNKSNAEIKIDDLNISTEKKIQSYFKNEKYEDEVENPKTSTQDIVLIVLLIISFAFILIISKKRIKFLNLLLVFILPINILAFSSDNKYTLNMVNEIRNIIVGEKQENVIYDIYEDKKVDVNDLIIHKILASKPNVEVETLFGAKGKKYYSSVSYKLNKDKLTNIEKFSYCVTTGDKCDDFNDNINLDGDIEIALTSNEKAQRMCVYLKNNIGLENTYCDTESYFVDTEKPTFEFKEQVVKVGADGDNYIKTKNVINSKFGISGGNVSCLSINKFAIGDNVVTCTAEANNGLIEEKKYIINKSNTLNTRAIFFGDSITHGWANEQEGFVDSWADLIGKNYDLKEYINCGSSGATISDWNNNTIIKVINGTVSTDKCPLTKYTEFNKKESDYVILSGGINDLNWGNLENGTFDNNNFNGNYNASTNAGAIENYLYLITTKYKDARIGYIITTYTPNYEKNDEQKQREYFTLLKNILNKWNIPYFELISIPELQNGANFTYLTDGLHLNKLGYNLVTPKIYNWMQTIPKYSR